MSIETHYRLLEAGRISGYSVASLRRKIRLGEIGFVKTGRIVTIPESELLKMLGKVQRAI